MSNFFLQRSKIKDDTFISKYKPYYIDNFKGNESLVGKIIPVKIKNSNQNSLFGEILTNDVEAA